MSVAFVSILVLALLFTLGLYALIGDETSSTEITSRTQAEREARQFGGTGGRSDKSGREESSDISDDESTGWGYSRLDGRDSR